MYKHILLPTDGSELSATAIRDGVTFAKEIGARVTALHVTAPFLPTELTPSALTAHMHEHDAKSKESAQRALGAVPVAFWYSRASRSPSLIFGYSATSKGRTSRSSGVGPQGEPNVITSWPPSSSLCGRM